jgi:hypothetical protein
MQAGHWEALRGTFEDVTLVKNNHEALVVCREAAAKTKKEQLSSSSRRRATHIAEDD